jgi:hypothetical protein
MADTVPLAILAFAALDDNDRHAQVDLLRGTLSAMDAQDIINIITWVLEKRHFTYALVHDLIHALYQAHGVTTLATLYGYIMRQLWIENGRPWARCGCCRSRTGALGFTHVDTIGLLGHIKPNTSTHLRALIGMLSPDNTTITFLLGMFEVIHMLWLISPMDADGTEGFADLHALFVKCVNKCLDRWRSERYVMAMAALTLGDMFYQWLSRTFTAADQSFYLYDLMVTFSEITAVPAYDDCAAILRCMNHSLAQDMTIDNNTDPSSKFVWYCFVLTQLPPVRLPDIFCRTVLVYAFRQGNFTPRETANITAELENTPILEWVLDIGNGTCLRRLGLRRSTRQKI